MLEPTFCVIFRIRNRCQRALGLHLRYRHDIVPARVRGILAHLLAVQILLQGCHLLPSLPLGLDVSFLQGTRLARGKVLELVERAIPARLEGLALDLQRDEMELLVLPLLKLVRGVVAEIPAVPVLPPSLGCRFGELARRDAGLVDLLPQLLLGFLAQPVGGPGCYVLGIYVGSPLDCGHAMEAELLVGGFVGVGRLVDLQRSLEDGFGLRRLCCGSKS